MSSPQSYTAHLLFRHFLQPPPSADEDPMATKLRKRLQDLLTELRSGAEGVKHDN